ncbi:MAG: alpha/beta fold hydrolase [Roseiflexaceae bacterium]
MFSEPCSIPARDGFNLAATCYTPAQSKQTVVVINSATAVLQRYYRPFASFLAEQGLTVITYDYRGIGGSRPASLRGFEARARDWALLDMAGVVDWIQAKLNPQRLFAVGHSYGGQTVGLLPNGHAIDALVTSSSQSGYWRLQGRSQVLPVAFHMHITLPLLSHTMGYMPWSRFSSAEDLPKGVALEWSSWCRRPGYLRDDPTLPLERFEQFRAPVLALSFDDDAWGTRRAVDAMMSAYPHLTRRHLIPADVGLPAIGHFGFFRPPAAALWAEIVEWLEQACPQPNPAPNSA